MSAWEDLADALLQRAALIARVDRNTSPDPLAGLKVDDDDLAALLAELPGLEPPGAIIDEAVDEALAEGLEAVLAAFETALDDPDTDDPDTDDPDTDDAFSGDAVFAGAVRSAGLSLAEARVLAVLCAVERDPRRQRLVGYLADDVTERRLTAWTLQLLDGRDALLAVGPGGGLRRAGYLGPVAETAWATAPVAVSAAVLWWLAGDRFVDPALPPGAEVITGQRDAGGGSDLVVVAGPDRVRRLQAAIVAMAEPTVLITPAPHSELQWDAVVRQATLAGGGVVVEITDRLEPVGRDRIERATHLRWAIVSSIDLPLSSLPRRSWSGVEVDAPAATDAEWISTFPHLSEPPYRLSAEQLLYVGRAARAFGGDIPAGVRRLAAGQIDATADRIRPRRTWDDLVLDPERTAMVREIALRWRQRHTVFGEWGFTPQPSTGVVALFAGPSGTGKTLAAEIIATELGVDLYKVDLANMISKYIGETEQNLSRVFDAAEASSVVLFFDEADALLGKRSEVSDAHDRYANIEVAYLLQRLERFEGVAVMATNLVKNIDTAFLRRLHLVVEFPMPEAPERRRIWRRCIPPGAPLGADLDLDRLADRFELSGGTIRNAVLGAAFAAAEAGTAITMDHAVTALRRELLKLGRLVAEADFA